MKVLLFGANGQVGRALRRHLGDADLVALDRTAVDVGDAAAVRAAILQHRSDVIINAAAHTAVDRAESEPDLVQRINGVAPGVMAAAARETGALLVHYSTDYVFDGSKEGAYVETDPPHPLSVYGRTKLAGEAAVAAAGCDHLIFRTSWVYSNDGANFMKTMLRLAGERDDLRIVSDQFGAPTSSDAIANATIGCVNRYLASPSRAGLNGIYHLTCAGKTSWHGFAEAIFEVFLEVQRRKHLVTLPIATSDYPTPAQRPRNSLLSNAKLMAAFHIALPDWRTALQEVRARN